MLKKMITYTNYNGVSCTEPFYFNLTKAEVLEMEMSTSGGLAEQLTAIVEAKDAPTLIKTFKEVVLKAYGEKSADGKHFMKSDEISAKFACTEAYSILFMELATDDEAAATFVKGIMPGDMQDKAMAPAIGAST